MFHVWTRANTQQTRRTGWDFLPPDIVMHHSFSFLSLVWVHWVFVAVCGLSLVVMSQGYFCVSCEAWALRCTASVVVAHGLSCPAVCGIFPDQGLNPSSLRWQVDS